MATYWVQLKATTTGAGTANTTTGSYTPAKYRVSSGGGSGTWTTTTYGNGSNNELGASSQRLMLNYGDTFNIMVDTADLDAVSGVNIGSTTVCANTAGTGTQTYDGVTYTLVSGGGAALTHQQNIGTYSDNVHYWHSASISSPSAGNFLYKIRIAKGNGGNQTFSFAFGVQAAVGVAGTPTNVSVTSNYSQQATLSWNVPNPYTVDYGTYESPELATRTSTGQIDDATPTLWAGSVVQATVTRGQYYRVYVRNFSLMHVNLSPVSLPGGLGLQFKYQNDNANSWSATPGGANTQQAPYLSPGSLDASDPVINIGWVGLDAHTATLQINTGPYTLYRSKLADGTVKAATHVRLSDSGFSTSGSINLAHPTQSYSGPTGGAGTYYVDQKLVTFYGGDDNWHTTGKTYVVPDGADYIPTAFDLGDDITNAPTQQDYESAEITIAGVTAGVNIAVSLTQSNNNTNWGFFKYDNGSGYSAYFAAGTTGKNVQNGSKLKVKLPSSSIRNDYRGIKLSVGSTYDWFKVTTAAAASSDDDEDVSGALTYGLEIISPKSANTSGASGNIVTYGPNNRATWIVAHNTFNIAAGGTYTITVTGMSATNKGDFHIFTQDPSPLSYLTGSGLTITRTNTGFTVSATLARTGVYYMVFRV